MSDLIERTDRLRSIVAEARELGSHGSEMQEDILAVCDEIERLQAENERRRERNSQLLGFALSILEGWPEAQGEMMDGFDLQERGEKYGLLIPREVSEPCSEWCYCVEYGFPTTSYRFSPDLAAIQEDSDAN